MTKDATVSARVEESVKAEAEGILQRLGIPVSVVINSLYRQIIAWNGLPFTMTLPRSVQSADELSEAELFKKLEHSYQQTLKRQGRPMEEVFDEFERKVC